MACRFCGYKETILFRNRQVFTRFPRLWEVCASVTHHRLPQCESFSLLAFLSGLACFFLSLGHTAVSGGKVWRPVKKENPLPGKSGCVAGKLPFFFRNFIAHIGKCTAHDGEYTAHDVGLTFLAHKNNFVSPCAPFFASLWNLSVDVLSAIRLF